MKLNTFLENNTLTAVELLPDNRLINIVIRDVEIYGIEVDNIPTNATITRVEGAIYEDGIITADNCTFTAADHTMLGFEETLEE
jgi:hypothetical protein